MMNKYLHRPMFRKGGSAPQGITSGLQRKGFAAGSTRDRLMKAVGPSRSNLNDFLINFGLNMASGSPTGNIFQTAAAQAKDPYAQFSKATRADHDLMRKVSLEAETLDIGQEQALELQALKNLSGENQTTDLRGAKEMVAQKLINPDTQKVYTLAEALEYRLLSKTDESRASLTDRIANTRDKYMIQGDEWDVANKKAVYFEDIFQRLSNPESGVPANLIGGILPTSKKLRETLLKKQSSIGKYFYDLDTQELKRLNGLIDKDGQKGFDWTDIDTQTFEEIIPTGEEVIDKEKIIGTTESGTKLTRAEAEAEAEARDMVLIPPSSGRGDSAKFRRENPEAISIVELQEIIDKERMSELYANVKQSERVR